MDRVYLELRVDVEEVHRILDSHYYEVLAARQHGTHRWPFLGDKRSVAQGVKTYDALLCLTTRENNHNA